MTYRDFLLSSMGMSNTEETLGFSTELTQFVKEEKQHLLDRYGVSITEDEYKLPYNFLIYWFSKGPSDAKITEEQVEGLLDTAKRKVEFDLLGIAQSKILESQIESGASESFRLS